MDLEILKKLKKWIKPEIKRISIYEPTKRYMGRSKQMNALHAEHYNKIKCYKKYRKQQ